ncbi:ketosteroid isomerase [Streptomyces inusitatus]|uniref:Ketosteroid isomerase n=1 Tax=Streptomyces inusitatus TaxID=68221 RepID=A0A918QHD8_9ACTN|nr:nuclear transport factor 2 family protein [Streptomyces inusitatus]GGZ47501.1 ketosteroid isomerase [Streptomyces inusitatus]
MSTAVRRTTTGDTNRVSDAGEPTRTTVLAFLARVQEGDPGRIAELFAERVDWVIAENPAVPWIKPRRTRADVADHFRELAAGQRADPAGTSVDAISVDGDQALLGGRLAGTVRATGKSFSSPFTMRLTVRDGLIVRYRVVEDAAAIAAACTPG